MSRLRPALAVATAAAMFFAGCGDDDGEDEDSITEVIERVASSGDPAACTEVETQRFVEQVVGEGRTGAAAIRSCEQNAGRGVAEDVAVSDIDVDGDTATAKAAMTGSTFDGQTLLLALVRDGDQWKLDEFTGFEAFDRDAMIPAYSAELSNGGVPPAGVECVEQRLGELSDEVLQDYFLHPDPDGIERVFGPCEDLLGGS